MPRSPAPKSPEAAPGLEEIRTLVRRFNEHRERYVSADYKEARLRQEFLDPFFAALGWDLGNKKNYSETFKEVVIEEALNVAGSVRSPDYTFRIGGQAVFYAEAKKPSVNLKTDPEPAFQLRRYAWTKKLSVSILTDFDEFVVYDTRTKPSPKDKASTARILYLTCTEYESRWQELVDLLSPAAIKHGALERFEKQTKTKGIELVDQAFLADIEHWREILAKDIARNNSLPQRSLNFAVQQTLDRIVFLRMCEDRGIEPFGRLLDVSAARGVYAALTLVFRDADNKYNSGLFHFRRERHQYEEPDTFTLSLVISDKILKEIIAHLYPPLSPYAFSVLPSDILGQAYEQFLGKTIRLKGVHQATIEEKPEVRKAGGVYYTPTYVVDYIVRHSTHIDFARATPKTLDGLTILDPACGSGSFLLQAYQFLLDWHLDWYLANGGEKFAKGSAPKLNQTSRGQWRLSTSERKRILVAHIYGVDIDAQAVEVTKLSLLLKVLEGESSETLQSQLSLLNERALPDLAHNIKCGNSLIGSDFGAQSELALDDELQLRINAFDWQAEFASVFIAGGFSIIIGNPPYINIQNIPREDREYYLLSYGEDGKLGKRYDIYQVFVLKALNVLKKGGSLGFILPNTFLMGHSYTLLRKRLLDTVIDTIVDLPQGVFKGVTVDNVLLFLHKPVNEREVRDNVIAVHKLLPKSDKRRLASQEWDEVFALPQKQVSANPSLTLNIHTNPRQAELFAKLEKQAVVLGAVTESSQGIILYKTAADAERAAYTSSAPRRGWKKLLRGKNIGRYETKWGGEYVHYGPWLWCARDEHFFNEPKLLLHAMRNKSLPRRLVATYDEDDFYNAHNLANIIAKPDNDYSLKYILGVFNSSLINYWYRAHFPNVNINPNEFRQIPIRLINFSRNEERAQHDAIAQTVEKLISLKGRKRALASAHENTLVDRQIAALDQKIDGMVYRLYGLSDEDIALVTADVSHRSLAATVDDIE